MTIVAFMYVTVANAGQGRLPLPFAATVVRYHGVIVTLWLTVLTLLIGQGFGTTGARSCDRLRGS